MGLKLKINGIIKESIVDGPGIRYVVFTQGCLHKCKGCHNPQTHDINMGEYVSVDDIFCEFTQNPLLKGITISGGEPFMQPIPLCRLAKKVRDMQKTVIIYSGYTFEQLIEMGRTQPEILELLRLCNVLIDGPYTEAERDLTLLFRGSKNQRIIELDGCALLHGQATKKGS